MEFLVKPLLREDWDIADKISASSCSGSFLQTRKFLSYHRDRFEDHSLLVFAKKKPVAVFHAAKDSFDETVVSSHPGLSFGGILSVDIFGSDLDKLLTACTQYWSDLGFKKLIYKAVPAMFRRMPVEADIISLSRLGATWKRCDQGACVDLNANTPWSDLRKRGYKKAQRAGLNIEYPSSKWSQFWHVLEENLLSNHGLKPTHTLLQIEYLYSLFPENIRLAVVLDKEQVVGGAVLFDYGHLLHAQYIAASEIGRGNGALDFLFGHMLINKQESKRYFSFGISSEYNGAKLNNGLYRFKTGFGAFSVAHHFFELELTQL